MRTPRGGALRSRVLLVAALTADLVLYASDGPYEYSAASYRAALAAQERVTDEWLALDAVVGTAIGVDGLGHAVLRVYVTTAGAVALPHLVGDVEVVPEVTGPFTALPTSESDDGSAADPKRGFERPVPIGVSTGHPRVSAGTIGARVTDGERAFALSNNHIFAASNGGSEGDNLLQPGVADGGKDPDDTIGTLFDFEPLHFCSAGRCTPNRIDAAIALTSPEDLGNETPDGGYGSPRRWTAEPALGMEVQKFGRTTLLTTGRITGIHATIDVQYRDGMARFEDQIVISPNGGGGDFSAGGDSGSLVVTNGRLLGARRPVGLLFAGSRVSTLANPIDPVLERFGVRIDGR
ncbi:MAG: hypothetical protein AB7T31_01850 [Gemmatimonadales bacterium]